MKIIAEMWAKGVYVMSENFDAIPVNVFPKAGFATICSIALINPMNVIVVSI